MASKAAIPEQPNSFPAALNKPCAPDASWSDKLEAKVSRSVRGYLQEVVTVGGACPGSCLSDLLMMCADDDVTKLIIL